jgi:DNA (cytosine-5)-methyltransferase 1
VRPAARSLGSVLADWFDGRADLTLPWLRADTRWQVISAELLLDRMAPEHARLLWPFLAQWPLPADTLAAHEELLEACSWVQREDRGASLLTLATELSTEPGTLDDPELEADRVTGLAGSATDLAVLVVPTGDDDASEEPVLVTKGVLRVAARFHGEGVDRTNRLTDGRLAVARMIGGAETARHAHLGLIELAASVCTVGEPACGACPLQPHCHAGAVAKPSALTGRRGGRRLKS